MQPAPRRHLLPALRERQEANKLADFKGKVLQVFGVQVRDAAGKRLMTDTQVAALFSERVVGHVLDHEGKLTDKRVEDLSAEDINGRDKNLGGLKHFYPYYEFSGEDRPQALRHSRQRHGTLVHLRGYLALKDDFATIFGLTFYDHAETPGLGGEIEKPAFQDQWPGKVLVQNNAVQYFRVLKPSEKVDNSSVHGPSGSTMTSKGITAFVNSDFAVYYKYFLTLKQQGG